MEEKEARLKVEDRYVQSRVYTDTFVGGCCGLDMQENDDAVAPAERYLRAYRTEPGAERQTKEQRQFWASSAKGF